jgi:uncharacterized protein YjbI with pentapeptide repeats
MGDPKQTKGPKEDTLAAILSKHERWLKTGTREGNQARLEGRALSNENFTIWNLTGAVLTGANLSGSTLRRAAGINIEGANLRGANLNGADLTAASARGAAFDGASFLRATLDHADLSHASFAGASFGRTRFFDTNVSLAKGLGETRHWQPSSLDDSTLYNNDHWPDVFLAGCELESEPSDPDLPPCVIACSAKDRDEVLEICGLLRGQGVRAWVCCQTSFNHPLFYRFDVTGQGRTVCLLWLSQASLKEDWLDELVRDLRRASRAAGRQAILRLLTPHGEELLHESDLDDQDVEILPTDDIDWQIRAYAGERDSERPHQLRRIPSYELLYDEPYRFADGECDKLVADLKASEKQRRERKNQVK